MEIGGISTVGDVEEVASEDEMSDSDLEETLRGHLGGSCGDKFDECLSLGFCLRFMLFLSFTDSVMAHI